MVTLEKAIYLTKEHMNSCSSESEEYQVCQVLLSCAEICEMTMDKLADRKSCPERTTFKNNM